HQPGTKFGTSTVPNLGPQPTISAPVFLDGKSAEGRCRLASLNARRCARRAHRPRRVGPRQVARITLVTSVDPTGAGCISPVSPPLSFFRTKHSLAAEIDPW